MKMNSDAMKLFDMSLNSKRQLYEKKKYGGVIVCYPYIAQNVCCMLYLFNLFEVSQ